MRFLAVFSVLAVLLATDALAAADRPNVVFILADDMGYGDTQPLNPDSKIPTPSFNRLAAEGMTFTDAHTPSAVCTPTRYGLVTGRYCWRSRLTRGVLNGFSPPLIEPDRPTVASFLKQHGYTCGIVGKWHLGLGFATGEDGKTLDFSKPIDGGPNVLGFDFSYVIPASLDFPPYLYIHDGRATALPTIDQPAQSFPAYLRKGPRAPDLVMEEVLDHLLEQATGFIRRKSAGEQPFFLYFPLTAPHKPVLPHPRFRGKTGLGLYADFVAQVDWTVGQVLDTIDDCGIADETLVIYTSDNGSYMYRLDDPAEPDHLDDATIQGYRAAHHTANGPLRGTKADIWEAGHRVPLFARWPGRIEPESRCAETICLTDFFATAAEIAGAPLPEQGAEDSFSFLPLLEGRPRTSPRPPVIHHSAGGMFAARGGQWKLVLGNGSGGRQDPRGKAFERPYHLFDMSKDLAETENLVEREPDVAARLENACEDTRSRGRSR